MNVRPTWRRAVDNTLGALSRAVDACRPAFRLHETGEILAVGEGIARVSGLPGVRADELIQFAGGTMGMAFNLDPAEVGVVLLDDSRHLEAGERVRRTGRVLDVPVGDALLGRAVDALGRPLDEAGPIRAAAHWPVERPAPPIMDRAPVSAPLQTGIKVIDALIPIGRGQRELILGDRQTGKTAIALDTIINQQGRDVVCVYCAIGKQMASVAGLMAQLREHGAMPYSIVVAASGESQPGLQFVAPYAATTMAEYFVEQGRDVLIVYDDLTWHARAYRQLSLLLRRPPGREAYPGDIFYIHARLLERSTHLRPDRGGGSLTALPIIETEAQNLAAYIPTNLISITDGQLFLSPTLFQRGILPAVDVGKSVSRVGGQAQLPAYRAVAGPLRLAYAQFQELEAFARFSTRLDEHTSRTIQRGQRVREVLKQPQFQPLPVSDQITTMLAVSEGLFDDATPERIPDLEADIRRAIHVGHAAACAQIEAGAALTDTLRSELVDEARRVVSSTQAESTHGND